MTIIIAPTPDEADQLRSRRLAAGLTQRQLAAAAEVALTTLANLEAGCLPKRSAALPRLRAALDTAEQDAGPNDHELAGGEPVGKAGDAGARLSP